MRGLLVPVLAALLLAGCVGGDDAPTTGESQQAAFDDGQSDPVPQTSEERPPMSSSTVTVEEVAVPQPYPKAIAGVGATAARIAVCDHPQGINTCHEAPISPGSPKLEFPFVDPLLDIEMEFTWERLDVTYFQLVVDVWYVPAEGEPERLAVGEGSTGMKMNVPDLNLAPGTITVELWPYSEGGAGPAHTFIDPQEQEFTMKGTLTMLGVK